MTQQLPSTRKAIKRVCILTGGGDAPGLNAVLRAFVRTSVDLGIEVYGSEDGFEGLIQSGRLVKLKKSSVHGILPKGGSILGCSNKANPFSYPTKDEQGNEVLVDMSQQVIDRVKNHEIDALVLLGGDGTMTMGMELMKRGVPVIGVPKTIDNDLGGTDLTFGLDTAVTTATWAIDALHSTAEAHDRVMVVEVMGRDAGWIALFAGIAGGADAILIPEIPYDINLVIEKIKRRSEAGVTFSIIVVGEGAYPKGGEASIVRESKKGHLAKLGGSGEVLANLLKDQIPHEVRVTVLGHLQRGGSPSSLDRILGTRFGVKAAKLCAEGRVGRLVSLLGTEVCSVPLETAVNNPKRVDSQGEIANAARAIGITLGD